MQDDFTNTPHIYLSAVAGIDDSNNFFRAVMWSWGLILNVPVYPENTADGPQANAMVKQLTTNPPGESWRPS